MLRALAAPLLPAATGVGIAIALRRRVGRAEAFPIRTVLLETAVVLGVVVVVLTETLSAFGALRLWPFAIGWSGLVVAAWSAALAAPETAPPARPRPTRGPADLPTRVAIVGCVGFAALALLVALRSPPNDWDSMTYHMARVAHWLANGSLRHYPTAETPQLFMPPLNAYAIANLQVLAGDDRFANLVHWLAYVGAALAASLAVARLGGDRRAQAIAALLVLTIPIAAAQSATTQADLLNAFLVVTLVAFAADRPSWRNVAWSGAVTGLGMLSKLTFALYAAPVLAWLAVRWAMRRQSRTLVALRDALLAAAAVGAITALLFAPHAARNLRSFGSAIGAPGEARRNVKESTGPVAFVSGVLRDSVLHVPLPGYGRAILALHRRLGLDPDDPRTTHLFDTTFTRVAERWTLPLTPSETVAGSPLHLLAAGCLLLVIVVRRRYPGWLPRDAVLIAAAAFVGWLLSQVPFKWQPSWSRFDMPFFAVSGIPVAMVVARLSPYRVVAVLAVFVLGALPALVLSVHRPLVDVAAVAAWPTTGWGLVALGGMVAAGVRHGPLRARLGRSGCALVAVGALIGGAHVAARVLTREGDAPAVSILTADRGAMRFRQNRPLQRPYERAAARVLASGCAAVGLELPRDEWEYPLWVLLGAAAGDGPRIRLVGVQNETAGFPPEGAEPCAVITTRRDSTLAGAPDWSQEVIATDPFVSVYWRRTPG